MTFCIYFIAMNRTHIIIIISCISFISCSVGNNVYSPTNKISRDFLQEDFRLLQQILEKKHPSLYWYTSKDSMDFFFKKYYQAISDSMTEQQFTWRVLAPMVSKIHCGHTSVGSSRKYRKWFFGKSQASFPLYLKVWGDSMAVIANLDAKDSVFKKGTLITSINAVNNHNLISKILEYLPEDGYANNINYIKLSGNFPYYHRNIFGLSKRYVVTYLDSLGNEKRAEIPLFIPVKDSTRKIVPEKRPKIDKGERKLRLRSLSIDSSRLYATMNLNTFYNGNLPSFFKKSFKTLRNQKINNLIIDLRNNGGGKVNNSTLLTKYVSSTPFKLADTLYSVCHGLGKYTRFIKGGILNNMELLFISRKKSDGKYHIGFLEKKLYHPKKRNHYNGNVYVLINGPTFSASALFCNVVKGQKNIKLVGEETGGGWHGNSGIMIPDITLPHSKTTIRLPLFRVVQYKHMPKNGMGISPDIYIGTNYDALLKGKDYKMFFVKEMIMGNMKY
jgi:hypothetical protein